MSKHDVAAALGIAGLHLVVLGIVVAAGFPGAGLACVAAGAGLSVAAWAVGVTA